MIPGMYMIYKEDVVTVKASFEEMLKTEVYKEDLFSDLQYVKVQRLELAGQSVLILEKYFNTVMYENINIMNIEVLSYLLVFI